MAIKLSLHDVEIEVKLTDLHKKINRINVKHQYILLKEEMLDHKLHVFLFIDSKIHGQG